jgi:hypothetical protein
VTDLPRRPIVLVLLVVACFVPRALMVLHWDILWGDTVVYLHAAEALEQGDLERAFGDLGLNLYPVILAGLRLLPVPWEVSGAWWSVLMATLAVLPLWGWTRRQFDDRVALGAGLCYAFHGKLVMVSPLILRDSTFWFLFALTIYCTWRAATEVRWRWFLTAGLAMTLAIYTRTEGWVLVVPLLGWCAGRMTAAAGSRLRLAAGAVVCLAVIPTVLALVNFTWLRAHPRWELLRTQHLKFVTAWWGPSKAVDSPEGEQQGGSRAEAGTTGAGSRVPRPTAGSAGAHAPTESHDPAKADVAAPALGAETPPAEWTSFTFNRKLVLRLLKSYTYIAALLTVCGLCAWWRVFLRRDHQTLFLASLLLVALVRIRYSQSGLDIRYFLPLVVLATPWMALGFFQIIAWTTQWTRTRIDWAPGRRAALTGALGILAAAGCMADSRMAAERVMRRQALLGKYIREHFGEQQLISGNSHAMNLLEHYAQGRVADCFDLRLDGEGSFSPTVESRQADMIVLWEDERLPKQALASAEARLTSQLGYRRVPDEHLPHECDRVLLLVNAARMR